jgi:hypothetical protein
MKKLISNLVIALCLLSSCTIFDGSSEIDLSTMSTDQLIQIIEDPESDLFWYATTELGHRGVNAVEASPALARALGYQRRDCDEAGRALISMGAEAKSAIPYLIPVLHDDQAISRAYASLVLGYFGEESKCAIPEIALLLWDVDPTVRGSAAITLDALTGENLVPSWDKLGPSTMNSISQDTPEGTFTKDARTWWEQEGKLVDWGAGSNNCDPPN